MYPENIGLYDSQYEKDACGVGLIADLKNIPTHQTVENGITILKNLMHRGATGGDPETGDGAGILVSIPDEFFRKVVKEKLPEYGKYGVAVIFGGTGIEDEIEKIITEKCGDIICWRDVPVDVNAVGKAARTTCPKIRQIFIKSKYDNQAVFERKLFIARRLIEIKLKDVYIPSMSSKSVVYKGLFMATQVENFYQDLKDTSFKSPIALVHQRYSTNTFPTWELAHPFRYIAHNGEINTLKGNLNNLAGREPQFSSSLLGDDLKEILPLIKEGQSDSASLDNMFELLVASGRDLCHAMLMLIPQAWGPKYHMGKDVRAFFEYHSALMEPWDGPAAVAFSDGINAGAILDRNGLRPARYTVTTDNVLVLASETGVLDIPYDKVLKKGRLRPGEIIYCDLENHRIVSDAAVKKTAARNLPYRRWIDENRIYVNGLFESLSPAEPSRNIIKKQKLFGYTKEDFDFIIKPMAEKGAEPVGSMGNDAALAVLSEKPQLLFNYFKQLFAQVTNPPIDSIREDLVMSLITFIGNKGNILEDDASHARVIELPRPIITNDELKRLRDIGEEGFKSAVINISFRNDLEQSLKNIAEIAVEKVKEGYPVLILSDKNIEEGYTPIPSLLAVTAVNKALSKAGIRPESAVILETGEAREIMHFALLLGYGATAICPYMALESISALVESHEIKADKVKATENYVKAVDKGLLKVMSKMGISTLRSYRSGQLFEAVGLNQDIIKEYFTGTASRINGIGLKEIEHEALMRRKAADEHNDDMLESGGQYHSKHLCTLRGLFEFATAVPVPLEEVESASSIVKRFVTGAMSLGSISPEAHETIAIAMNKLGGMSNCGEGGEDPERYKPNEKGEVRSSAIKQIASGRFGVTIEYLTNAKELQIKMAQGAKPGEGGQLPGHKVNAFIAKLRHSMPNVSLISPPPHHDIYSIEDLAQLIYDLRNSNPEARISVKLVSEVGVGTIAAGVAKAHSDVILISGHDGGTGASPLTSIKHAGLPWELGLAEAQQTLVLNKLRGRVRLQTDGQLKTGRDVIIAALLGAEEFGFATTVLASLGCVMMRQCHSNTCPVGIATQDADLRKKFTGKPEYVENFLMFVAEEVREYLAALGLRTLDEAIGRSDLLQVNKAIEFYKAKNLDFSKILQTVSGKEIKHNSSYSNKLENYDREYLLAPFKESIETGKSKTIDLEVKNINRTVGTELSHNVAKKYGLKGLEDDTINVNFKGCAGQSFGAFLAHGITFNLEGEANDFVGKGISGGKIIVKPAKNASFKASENVVAGNVIGYGGTSGKIFLNGQAGERFAIRNSGFISVVEGIGDHGCEYMTGGRVVILGNTGVNFAAGMTGGIAYVLDMSNDFDLRCNTSSVDLENIEPGSEDEKEILSLLNEHIKYTDSQKAKEVVADWENYRDMFVKVFPVDYKKALQAMKENGSN